MNQTIDAPFITKHATTKDMLDLWKYKWLTTDEVIGWLQEKIDTHDCHISPEDSCSCSSMRSLLKTFNEIRAL